MMQNIPMLHQGIHQNSIYQNGLNSQNIDNSSGLNPIQQVINGSPFNTVPNNFTPIEQVPQVPPVPVPVQGTVPLSLLLEFAIHRTYSEISVLENLFPSKTDMDKKIELVKFANQTKQLYIRILSLVRWAGSVGKVVKCSDIISFLDKQSSMFVETADKLHMLANQLVVQARLPNFSVPAAVDVLTTGTYPRLPTCIREKIIPLDPIKPNERKATIKRIEQIVLFRLAIEVIPPQITTLTVKSGVVHLHVPGEFDASLTLMGDTDDIPWRLLELKLLVEDFDVGCGKSLVHDRQINFLHELAQSRLFTNENAMTDLYNMLHSFCLSLQLQVLCSQADRLMKLRWGKFITIEEYIVGQKLTLSYWKYSPYKSDCVPMTVIIKISTIDEHKPLQVVHSPPLPLVSLNLAKDANHINHLSVESLIHNSVTIRSYHLLCNLKTILEKHVKVEKSHFAEFETTRSCVLVIPLLMSSKNAEPLRIHVDPQTGAFIPTMSIIPRKLLDKVEREINKSETSLLTWWEVLQLESLKIRCKQSLQHLPASIVKDITLSDQHENLIDSISKNRVCLNMTNHPSYYLILELVKKDKSPVIDSFKYHLLRTTRKYTDSNTSQAKAITSDGKFNLKNGLYGVTKLVLHPDPVTSSQKNASTLNNPRYGQTIDFSKTDEEEDSNEDAMMRQLKVAVYLANLRIPFAYLLECLRSQGFNKCGLRNENGVLECWVDEIPEVDKIDHDINFILMNQFKKCTFRCGPRKTKHWIVDVVMKKPDFEIECSKDVTSTGVVCSYTYERHLLREEGLSSSIRPDCVKQFYQDWSSIAHLFSSVHMFSKQLQLITNSPICKNISIYSYNYRSIILKYGSSLTYTVTVYWTPEKRFILDFGRTGGVKTLPVNPHWLTRLYIVEDFNSHKDLMKLMYLLNDTLSPLCSISHLSVTSVLGVTSKTYQYEDVFTLTPVTATRFRLSFYGIFVLDIYCRMDGTVAIRDGSFSQFELSKSRSHTIPIQSIGSFLSMFQDPKDARHQSDQLCDDPSSPAVPFTSASSSTAQSNYGLTDVGPKLWAGSLFFYISHSNFDKMCQPAGVGQFGGRVCPITYRHSILEQFLSSVLCHRHFTKSITTFEHISLPLKVFSDSDQSIQPLFGTAFTTRHPTSLQFLCYLNRRNPRQLSFKVYPPVGDTGSWNNEDIAVLERYFLLRVYSPPYRFNSMKAFCTMLSAPSHLLKDFIQLMRLEMATNQRSSLQFKWFLSLSLTVHPRAAFAPTGMASIIVKDDKVLMFVQLVQNLAATPQTQNTQQTQPITVDIPLLFTPKDNSIDLLAPSLASNTNTNQLQYLRVISQMLRNLTQSHVTLPPEAAFLTVVRYLMEHLVL